MRKKIIALTFIFIMILAFPIMSRSSSLCLSANAADLECGKDAYYNFNSTTGKLTIYGKGSIKSWKFYANNNIKEVIISNGITEIEDSVFYDCDSLTKVTIASSVTTFGERIFGNCDGLLSLKIPNTVTTVGTGTFIYCKNLKTVELSNSMKSVPIETFSGCKSLKSVVIPSSIKSIEKRAFYDCDSLETFSVPHSVEYIGSYVFRNCDMLNYVYMGLGIKLIDDRAFYQCSSLEKIRIDSKQVTIDPTNLYLCEKFEKIYGYQNSDVHTFANDKNYQFVSLIQYNLSCTGYGENFVNLTWDKVKNANGYVIYKTQNGVTTTVKTIFENITSYKVEKLYSGSEYQFRVRAFKKVGTGYAFYNTSQFHNAHTNPAKIKISSGYKNSLNTIKLTWDKVANASGYRVYLLINSQYVGLKNLFSPNLNYYTYTNLDENTKYTFKVRSFKFLSDGTVAWGTPSDAFVGKTQSRKLEGIKNVASTTTSVKLTWNELVDVDSYRVYMRFGTGYKFLSVVQGHANTSYTVKNLSPGTSYSFWVAPYYKTPSGLVRGILSNEFKTMTIPSKVFAVSKYASPTALKFTWTSTKGATGYSIFMYINKKWQFIEAIYDVNQKWYYINGLQPNTKYYFIVKPFNKSSSGLVWGENSSVISHTTDKK